MIQLKKYQTKIKEFLTSHEYFSAALFFILLITIFFFPVIFQGKTFSNSIFNGGVSQSGPYGYEGTYPPFVSDRDSGASVWQDEPLSNYIGEFIKKNGHIPLWNSNMGLGYPILASFHLGLFSPLNFPVFMFSSASIAWDFMILIKIFLAGFLTYLFARKIKLDKLPSLLAGVVFMFSGYTLSYLNMPHFSIEILIPLVLLSYELFLDKQDLKRFGVCVLTNALIVLPGMPEATFFILLLGGFWFLFSLFFLHPELSKKRRIFVISGTLVAGVTALLLTAVQILPFLELLKISFNNHSYTNVGLGYISFSTVPSLFLPFLFYPINSAIGSLTYIGVIPVALALLTLLNLKHVGKQRKMITIFFGLFVFFGLAKIFGFPLVNWMGLLPIIKTLIFTKYFAPEITFGVAMLAALGCSLILEKKIPCLNTKLAIILLFFVSSVLYTFRENFPNFASGMKDNDTIVRKIFDYFWPYLHLKLPAQFTESIKLSPTMIFYFLSISLGIFIFLFFWLILLNSNYKRKYFGSLILIFSVLELFIYAFPLVRMDRYDNFTKAPFIEKLQQDSTETFRTYGQGSSSSWPSLFPNTSSVFGVQDIRFLMALGVGRYFDFINKVLGVPNSEISTIRFTGDSILPLDNRIFDLMNVKYFLVPKDNDNQVAKDILKNGEITGNSDLVHLGSATLNKEILSGFLLHAPSSVKFTMPVDEKNDFFSFNYGIAGSGVNGSDGVRFKVEYQCDGKEKEILNDLVDPVNNSKYQSWQKANLDLSDCVGKEANLTLISDTNGNGDYDHFFVGNFPDTNPNIVYNGEIEILKNNGYLPRTFVVHRATYLADPPSIFQKLKDPRFDIRNNIIIEKNLSNSMFSGNNSPETDTSQAKITNYQDEKVDISADMQNAGFLVLLDQYYPGWKAYVDGKDTEIYATDYTFRSIYLNKGKHAVEFIYDPLSYKIGKYVTLATIILLLGLFVFRKKIESRINRYVSPKNGKQA